MHTVTSVERTTVPPFFDAPSSSYAMRLLVINFLNLGYIQELPES